MECDLRLQEMIGFHFGEIDNGIRQRVEAHLLLCPKCLREFFVLKRAIETSETTPSEKARMRLRDEIAHKVASRKRATWSCWHRPLAVAVAVAAVVLATATVNIWSSGPGRAPQAWPKSEPRPMP